MLFLMGLESAYTVVSTFFNMFLPVLPQSFLSYIQQLLDMISGGARYAVWMFFTPLYLRTVFTWLLGAYAILYGWDLTWKAINLIKWRKGASDD